MFDEHLGVQQPKAEQRKVTRPRPKASRVASMPAAVAASVMIRSDEPSAERSDEPSSVRSVEPSSAGTSTAAVTSAVSSASSVTTTTMTSTSSSPQTSSPSQSVAEITKPVPQPIKRSPRRSRSAGGTTVASTVTTTTTRSSKPSVESTKTSVVVKDFQAKFLEFSQRNVEVPTPDVVKDAVGGSNDGAKKRSPATKRSPSKDDNTTDKGDKIADKGDSIADKGDGTSDKGDSATTTSAEDEAKTTKSSLAMQVDGCADDSSEFDSDDELREVLQSKHHLNATGIVNRVSPLNVIVDNSSCCDEREMCETSLKISDLSTSVYDAEDPLPAWDSPSLPMQVDGAGDEEEAKTGVEGAGVVSESVTDTTTAQLTQEIGTPPQPSTPGSQPRTPLPSATHSPVSQTFSQQSSPRIPQPPPPYPGQSPTMQRPPHGFPQTGPGVNHPNMSPRSLQSPGTRPSPHSMPSPLASPRSMPPPPQHYAVASPCQQGAVQSPRSIHSPQSRGGTPQLSPRGSHTPLSLSQPGTPQPLGMHLDNPHLGPPMSMGEGPPPPMYGSGGNMPQFAPGHPQFAPGQPGHPRMMHPGMARMQGVQPRKSFLPPENWARILNRLQMGAQQHPDVYGGQKKALDSALLSQLVCLSQMPRGPVGAPAHMRPGMNMPMQGLDTMPGMPPGTLQGMPPGTVPGMPPGTVFIQQQQQQQMPRHPGMGMVPTSQQVVMNMPLSGPQQPGMVMPPGSQSQPGMGMPPGMSMPPGMPSMSMQQQQQWASCMIQQRPGFAQGVVPPVRQQMPGMPPSMPGMPPSMPGMPPSMPGMPPGMPPAMQAQPPPPPPQQLLPSTAAQQKDRLPLLEEQPLLLEDLLEQVGNNTNNNNICKNFFFSEHILFGPSLPKCLRNRCLSSATLLAAAIIPNVSVMSFSHLCLGFYSP